MLSLSIVPCDGCCSQKGRSLCWPKFRQTRTRSRISIACHPIIHPVLFLLPSRYFARYCGYYIIRSIKILHGFRLAVFGLIPSSLPSFDLSAPVLESYGLSNSSFPPKQHFNHADGQVMRLLARSPLIRSSETDRAPPAVEQQFKAVHNFPKCSKPSRLKVTNTCREALVCDNYS